MRTDMPRLTALCPVAATASVTQRAGSYPPEQSPRCCPSSILSFNSLQPMLLRVTLIPAAPASCSAYSTSLSSITSACPHWEKPPCANTSSCLVPKVSKLLRHRNCLAPWIGLTTPRSP